jgi:competence protein ComEA
LGGKNQPVYLMEIGMSKMLQKLLLLLSLMIPFALAWASVDVNNATQAQLESVDGIGPAIAQRIILERQQNGAFKNTNDLVGRIKGIGPKSVQKLEANGLTVGGGGGVFSGNTAGGGGLSSFFSHKQETAPADTSNNTNTNANGSSGGGSGGLSSFFHRKKKPAPADASDNTNANADTATTDDTTSPTKHHHHRKRKQHNSDSDSSSASQ